MVQYVSGHVGEMVIINTREVLLTVHHGTLMNEHQLGTLFLVCLLRVNASTCLGRY
jgi:hypothetical protein